MKSIIRNLITFAFAFFVVVLLTEPTYAMEISVTDEYGNVEVIASIPDEQLQSEPISTFGLTRGIRGFDAPHPDAIPGWHLYLRENSVFNNFDNMEENVEGFEMVLPKYANFFFIDFGPNWATDDNTLKDNKIPGRYLYLYYGYPFFNTDLDRHQIAAGGNVDTYVKYGAAAFEFDKGLSGDAYNPDDNSLIVRGPFALIFYNPDKNVSFLHESGYTQKIAYATTCTITGLTSVNDDTNLSYYPKLSSFLNDTLTNIDTWSQYMGLFASDNVHNCGWNGETPDLVITPDSEMDDFWSSIANGDWTGDGVFGLIGSALQGITYVWDFIVNSPIYFDAAANALPEPLAVFIICCFSLIVSIVLFKIALQFIRG